MVVKETKAASVDILLFIVDYSPSLVREYMMQVTILHVFIRIRIQLFSTFSSGSVSNYSPRFHPDPYPTILHVFIRIRIQLFSTFSFGSNDSQHFNIQRFLEFLSGSWSLICPIKTRLQVIVLGFTNFLL